MRPAPPLVWCPILQGVLQQEILREALPDTALDALLPNDYENRPASYQDIATSLAAVAVFIGTITLGSLITLHNTPSCYCV